MKTDDAATALVYERTSSAYQYAAVRRGKWSGVDWIDASTLAPDAELAMGLALARNQEHPSLAVLYPVVRATLVEVREIADWRKPMAELDLREQQSLQKDGGCPGPWGRLPGE